MQSRHRRYCQGYRRPRGRCPRRLDGSRRRPRHHPVPHAEPLQGSSGVGSARAVRPHSLQESGTPLARGLPHSRTDAGYGHKSAPRRCAGRRRGDGRRAPVPRSRRHHHGRDVPTGPHPPRHGHADSRGPSGRPAIRRACTSHCEQWSYSIALQDRDPSPRGWADRRLEQSYPPGRGRRRVPLLVPRSGRAPAPGALLDHLGWPSSEGDHSAPPEGVGAVRWGDQWTRSALLSVGRGQGREVPRRKPTSSVPGARGVGHRRALRERPVHFPACRRPARIPACRAGTRARTHDPARVRDRVRLLPTHTAHSLARGEGPRAPVLRGTDQRHHRL